MASSSEPPHHRPIRSFVRREGRLTTAQQQALKQYLPRYAIADSGTANGCPLLNPTDTFGNYNPLIIEIGFGNGTLLATQAAHHPDFNFIGIEVHRPGIGQLLRQLHEQGIANVRVMTEDAHHILRHRIPPHCLHSIWIFFPDPWPKKKHHKRRLITQPFAELTANCLAPGGILHIATDWQDYAEQAQQAVIASRRFVALDAQQRQQYPFRRLPTRFEQRGIALGHQVFDLCYRCLV